MEHQEHIDVINAKKYLDKAEETNGLGVEISNYRKALFAVINENKRIEQNEKEISDEMEQIEAAIDNQFPPKSIHIPIKDYNISNKNEWYNDLNKDKQFLELYDFYNDINHFHTNELIHQLLRQPHEYRSQGSGGWRASRCCGDNQFNKYQDFINQYDHTFLNDIQVSIIGLNYCTGEHEVWGKVYIPKEVAISLGIYKGVSMFSSIVKYTNKNIPWRVLDNNELSIINAAYFNYQINNTNKKKDIETPINMKKSNELYCNKNRYCKF